MKLKIFNYLDLSNVTMTEVETLILLADKLNGVNGHSCKAILTEFVLKAYPELWREIIINWYKWEF